MTQRGSRLRVSPQWAVSIAGALAVIGFVGYAQWNGSPERAQFATSVQQVLADQVSKLEDEQEDLRGQLAAAEAQVLDFQTAFLSPPFRIEAIGSDGLLDRFTENAAFKGRVAQRIDVFGLEFASQTT